MTIGEISSCGDDLISIPVGNTAMSQQLASRLRTTGEWLECVGGIDSVVLRFDAATLDMDVALRKLRSELPLELAQEQAVSDTVEIPVVYGGAAGPDLEILCKALQLSREEFVALHHRDEYLVEMLGFTPGFAYVGGLDERLNVPRLEQPRQHVAAGSIGIAGGRTGVYALPGPGGWPLIGCTPIRLFDAGGREPFLLQPGMRVRFKPVGESHG